MDNQKEIRINSFRYGKNTKMLLNFYHEGMKDQSVVISTPKGYFLSPKAVEEYRTAILEKIIRICEEMKCGERPTWENGDPQWWDECAEGFNQALFRLQEKIKKERELIR